MSDEALNAAMNAARGALRTGGDVAEAIAIGIHAYVKQRPMETMRLLRPMPGDVVVFHFVERLTQEELNSFVTDIQPAVKQFEGVKFIAVDQVAEITVVRNEFCGLDALRKAAETLEAEQLMKEARGDDQS